MSAALHAALLALLALLAASPAQAAVPGTFFWKPRVALDITQMAGRQGQDLKQGQKPTWPNIEKGYVVLINGYQAGLTVAALASYFEDVREAFPHLHPGHAHYYTNMYRWAVRYLSLIPEWLSNRNKSYMSTHRVWNKRFYYMDYFVPQWMRKLLFFVSKDSWATEDWEWSKFVKYAEPQFGRYYRYPNKVFNNWASQRQPGTVENLDITNASIQ